MKGSLTKGADIDLGLAILAATTEPPHTADTIAAFCGCTRQNIQKIEQRALRKLRVKFYCRKSLERDLLAELQQ